MSTCPRDHALVGSGLWVFCCLCGLWRLSVGSLDRGWCRCGSDG